MWKPAIRMQSEKRGLLRYGEIRGATTLSHAQQHLIIKRNGENEKKQSRSESRKVSPSCKLYWRQDDSERTNEARLTLGALSNLIRYHLLQQPTNRSRGDLLERQEAAISTARRGEASNRRIGDRESKANGDMAAEAVAAINCKCSMTFGVARRRR